MALSAAAVLLTPTITAAASDKSGLKANRLSLPAGPGSLEGVGENVSVSLNMGSASYAVPIELPKGYPTLSPSLALRYNSGAGASDVALGWSLGQPYITRMTSQGLPRYDATDTFVTHTGDELVRLPGTSTFRARYEGSFIRYTWMDESTGAGGWWRAEYPDGSVGHFGADAGGAEIGSARLSAPSVGVFRYYLVERVDPLEHSIRYSYNQDDYCLPADDISPTPHICTPTLTSIAWVFDGDSPRYEAQLTYGPRQDNISDAKAGFDIRRNTRLRDITVTVNGAQRNRTLLSYHPYEQSGGLSQLASISTFGQHNNSKHAIEFSFTYTNAADAPMVFDLGSIGVDFRAGAADLVDINGDGLADIVDTTGTRHIFHVATQNADTQSLSVGRESAASGSMHLASHAVRMADINGDGRSDMLDAQTGNVLWNRGDGDWDFEEFAAEGVPNPATDANLRFFDYDNDKRIDLISNGGTSCVIYRSDGTGQFHAVDDGEACQAPGGGASFTEGVKLADINGDGMQDLAQYLSTGEIRYRLSLGYGRWLGWKTMYGLPPLLPESDLHLVDINGDSLADVVKVAGGTGEIEIYINRSGSTFWPFSVSVVASNGTLVFSPESSVRFADMNGNGSTDIVSIANPSGAISFIDIYPERAGLLKSISNGIGSVTELNYGSSAHHMANDGGADAWRHKLPFAVLTVDRIEQWSVGASGRQVRELHYSSGFYDVNEKQFRGFATVSETTQGNTYTESGSITTTFDVGDSDSYRKGLMLEQSSSSGDRLLSSVSNEYIDCPLHDVPTDGLALPVRFICLRATTTTHLEGLDASQSVNTRDEYGYDGHGNRIKTRKLGVVARAGLECGESCLGDEIYEATDFVHPDNTGGLWLLRAPYRQRVFGSPGGDESETLTYYDGEPFEGLALGQLRHGLATRVTSKVRPDSNAVINSTRQRYDSHGNAIEILDANGHRQWVVFDELGVLITAEEIVFDAPGHAPYSLRQSMVHHPVFELPVRSTDWQRFESGQPASDALTTVYGYDGFGQLIAIASPGDTLTLPTQRFSYELQSPSSRIIASKRSGASGDDFDIVSAKCFDGLGRALQSITQTGPATWLADGFTVYGTSGEAQLKYQPHTKDSLSCASRPPLNVLRTDIYRDALARETTQLLPDASLHGTPSLIRTAYLPLQTRVFDPEDNDSASPHFDTPTTTRTDGLGRTVAIERMLSGDARPVSMTVGYDDLGNIHRLADAAGNTRVTEYDLLGRTTRIIDPDAGIASFTYDATGNVISRTDARGVQVTMSYDEAARLTAKWETADEASTRVTYEYDGVVGCGDCTNTQGRLSRTRYPVSEGFDSESWGEDSFGFDARGRGVYSGRALFGTLFETRQQFDNADRLVAVTHPNGRTITSTLDNAGRVTAMERFLDSLTYTDRGLPQRQHLANGTATTWDYDAMMRVTELETLSVTSALIQSHRYQRDRIGNILAVSDERVLDNATPSADAEYVYDSLYRLNSAVLDAGRKPQETLAIAYDRVDNIIRKTSDLEARSWAHVGSYQYDVLRPHAVAHAGDRAYRYDASGNTVQRGEQSLRWDHDGRLVALSHSDKSIARYAYGVDHERVVKREGENFTFYITPDFEVRNGVATTWVRAGRHRIAKIQEPSFAAEMLPDLAPASAPDNVINVADAHAGVVTGEPDEVVDMLLVASAMAALIGPHGLATFVHQDHLGSSAVTTDAHSAVLQRTGNYPYGEIRYQSDYLEDYSWAGQERDVAAGLSYHSARYLDTRTGRWLSADPLFLGSPGESLKSPAEFGLYGFGRGNPISLLDPSGLVTVGEWLLDMAGEASDSGNTVATYALGVAYVGWGTFGMEGVSNLADKAAHGKDIGGGDVLYAAAELATFGKGGGLMGAGAKMLGRAGRKALGKLTSMGGGRWRSTAGLIYGQGSKHGNRVKHVLDHVSATAGKTKHSLFSSSEKKILGVVDDAWARRGSYSIHPQSGNWNYRVSSPGAGTTGENFLNISVRPGTSELITAFPVH